MKQEFTAWLADELSVPLVEDAPDGSLRANAAALASLGPGELAGLGQAVATVAHAEDAQIAIDEKIEGARRGLRGALHPRPGLRLLFLPSRPGQASVLIIGANNVMAETIQARAAAADLAAGVSHEVSNALSAIIGWSQVAQERPDKAPPEEALSLILQSAQAARDATQDLLRMVRKTDQEKARTDLSVVIEDVVRLIRPEAQKRRVKIITETGDQCWVKAKRSQVFSMVWNLAHNAVHIMPAGGEVQLSSRLRGEMVELEVRDNGPGMSAEQRDKAFDPYFTTRAEGTGLGLAIVRDTVEALDGRIRLDTSPGHGAQFRIQLPSAGRMVDSGSVRKPSRISRVMKEVATQGKRVLVVEDDAGVRGLISTTLELCGLSATCAANAEEARQLEGKFDAAVIDLTLPDARGDILLGELRDGGSVWAAAIMSGAPPPDDIDPRGKPERWLRKPFDPADLVVCLRELIDSGDTTVVATT